MDSTPLKEYLQAAIAAADKGKLSALMASFGYRSFQTITPSMLMNALDTYGRDFSIPFGRLVRYSLDSRSSADGSRSAYSGDWTEAFTTVTDFLINGANSANDILQSVYYKDSADYNAQANYIASQAMLESARSKSTLWLILGIVAVVLIAVIIIVALRGRKR